MVVIERERGCRVYEELLAAEDRRPGDRADRRVLGGGPAGPPEPQRVVAQRLYEVLAVRVSVTDERDGPTVAARLLRRRRHRVVLRGHAVHGQVRQVPD